MLQAQRLTRGDCCTGRRARRRLARVRKVLREYCFALEVIRVPARLVRGPAAELVFEVFGTEDGNFREEKFAAYARRFCVVQDCPYRDLCGHNVSII